MGQVTIKMTQLGRSKSVLAQQVSRSKCACLPSQDLVSCCFVFKFSFHIDASMFFLKHLSPSLSSLGRPVGGQSPLPVPWKSQAGIRGLLCGKQSDGRAADPPKQQWPSPGAETACSRARLAALSLLPLSPSIPILFLLSASPPEPHCQPGEHSKAADN